MDYSKICFRIARGRARETGEPAMVLVRFEYSRSDSERKLLIGQFNLTHVKQEIPDIVRITDIDGHIEYINFAKEYGSKRGNNYQYGDA